MRSIAPVSFFGVVPLLAGIAFQMLAGAAAAQDVIAPASAPPLLAGGATARMQGGPLYGANSFSRGEARQRLRRFGFTDLHGLKEDDHGVWRATATRGGSPVKAWLDYRGSVGTD